MLNVYYNSGRTVLESRVVPHVGHARLAVSTPCSCIRPFVPSIGFLQLYSMAVESGDVEIDVTYED